MPWATSRASTQSKPPAVRAEPAAVKAKKHLAHPRGREIVGADDPGWVYDHRIQSEFYLFSEFDFASFFERS